MLRRTFGLLAAVVVAGSVAGCAGANWQQAGLSSPAYDDETHDYGIEPTTVIRTADFDAATPTRILGAQTVTTPQMRDLMLSNPPPLIVDVLGGNQTASLPGAVWWRGAGLGNGLHDQLQAHFAARLAALTGGDKARSVVFFCLSKTCWLSHNAAVRAVALGYTKVHWYRGGRNAWRAAGLPLEPVGPSTF